jgi:methylmalonyl-CoA epimerase
MFTKIHNIVIAVNSIEEAAKQYADNFGLQISRTGTMPEQGIKSAYLPIGDATIEFIEPLDPEQGLVSKLLKNQGEGLYMIELRVESIDSTIQALQERGVRLIGADPEARAKGSMVFIHPQSAKGVLIALVER